MLQRDAHVPSVNETAEFNTTWENLVLASCLTSPASWVTNIYSHIFKWLKNFLFISCYRKCAIKPYHKDIWLALWPTLNTLSCVMSEPSPATLPAEMWINCYQVKSLYQVKSFMSYHSVYLGPCCSCLLPLHS